MYGVKIEQGEVTEVCSIILRDESLFQIFVGSNDTILLQAELGEDSEQANKYAEGSRSVFRFLFDPASIFLQVLSEVILDVLCF